MFACAAYMSSPCHIEIVLSEKVSAVPAGVVSSPHISQASTDMLQSDDTSLTCASIKADEGCASIA